MFGFCVFERNKLVATDDPAHLSLAKVGLEREKPDRLSGFQERVMEQNQTLNAANAHVDGAVLLEGIWVIAQKPNRRHCPSMNRQFGVC
jgi:hypothetical protein